jgi:hypothetical protein
MRFAKVLPRAKNMFEMIMGALTIQEFVTGPHFDPGHGVCACGLGRKQACK